MNARSFSARLRARLREWFLRSAAMREARARTPEADPARARALAQARLLTEVARRVAEPIEALPPGAHAGVTVGLCRDASYWALAALQPAAADAPDLAAMWIQTPAERVQLAAGGADAAEAVRKTLTEGVPERLLDASDADGKRAIAFADALIAELNRPMRRVRWVALQRWLMLGLGVVALAAAAFGIHKLILGPNLASGKTFRASSNYPGCPCEGLFFHTIEESNPWVELDLGAIKSVKRIDAVNRQECCEDRAVPTVVEVSTDRAQWTEVARRTTEFSKWTAKFPARPARYVRLRVPRYTQFHLKEVEVR